MTRSIRVGVALAILVSLGACAGDDARDVLITIEHSRFQPERLEVERGTTVRFTIRNTDPIEHEFILGDEEMQRMHEKGMDMDHHGPGQVSLPANEEVTTTYTFREPGTLIYGCHVAGHYDFGMRGTVEIVG